jgi:hypothetical protein
VREEGGEDGGRGARAEGEARAEGDARDASRPLDAAPRAAA